MKFKNEYPRRVLTARQRKRPEDIRGPFFRDQTAIIHSLAFRRLKHKTQVFFSPENDHICTRIEHSLHVATISATICRALKLDIDLATAIGLGHDLGHAPFGHAGEKWLENLFGGFVHELHSLRVVDKLENYGQGLNLTYAVRDGIVSHCGEVDEQFIEISPTLNDLDNLQFRPVQPSTWEACVVRLSDSIAYLGRDLEDAVAANLINKEDLPEKLRKGIGQSNSEIINNLVFDVIDWSTKNGKIGFSPEKFALISEFKEFSREKIYDNPKLKYWRSYSGFVIETLKNYLIDLYEKYQNDYERYANSRTPLDVKFGKYLKSLHERYQAEKCSSELIVRDYIAGMTDAYALHCFQNILTMGTRGL
ncbi:MAG TPA: HD domain-containing protein [Candidatus Marinimicrobia bacterium]|nr:HD domain-containing protein [Candidatus Neomarinimicrobiota bacterium]